MELGNRSCGKSSTFLHATSFLLNLPRQRYMLHNCGLLKTAAFLVGLIITTMKLTFQAVAGGSAVRDSVILNFCMDIHRADPPQPSCGLQTLHPRTPRVTFLCTERRIMAEHQQKCTEARNPEVNRVWCQRQYTHVNSLGKSTFRHGSTTQNMIAFSSAVAGIFNEMPRGPGSALQKPGEELNTTVCTMTS